ncbi:MAG: glutamyl-tRNA reductase [Actinobacteria bacterium]|nr:glutamyl-tRNA reductase [Actinomycetota bacterium]
MTNMNIHVLGINHRTSSFELREKLYFSKPQIHDIYSNGRFASQVREFLILSTCNRTEVYGACESRSVFEKETSSFLARSKLVNIGDIKSSCYLFSSVRCVSHIFKVAAGLDSMIIGEEQILGQVKDTLELAEVYKIAGLFLCRLFKSAIHAGKRCQTDFKPTALKRSVSHAALCIAKKVYGDFSGLRSLVIGAGKTSELVLESLSREGISCIIVANRTYEKAKAIAQKFRCKVERLDNIRNLNGKVDMIVSCTSSPVKVISKDHIMYLVKKINRKPFLIIDLAVPRDIDTSVTEIENVQLYNIDDLQSVMNIKQGEDQKFVSQVTDMIKYEVRKFEKWYNTLDSVDIVVWLIKRTEEIRKQKFEKFISRFQNLNDEDVQKIEALTKSIANGIVHKLIANLKHIPVSNSQMYIEALRFLFDFDKDIKTLPQISNEGKYYKDWNKVQQISSASGNARSR